MLKGKYSTTPDTLNSLTIMFYYCFHNRYKGSQEGIVLIYVT